MPATPAQPSELELARRIVHAREHRRFQWQAAVSGPGSSRLGAGHPDAPMPAQRPPANSQENRNA